MKLQSGQATTYDGSDVWSFELAPGTYTVTASAAGYLPASVTRTVVAGQTEWGSVGLDPVPAPGPDAGAPGPDAAAPAGPDAATPAPADGGTPAQLEPPPAPLEEPAIAAQMPPEVLSGCGCSASAGGIAAPVLALLVAGAAGRRRLRPR